MESHKIMVDGEGLRTLAVTCRRNGTQDAWIDVALTWINAAEPEIVRLRADLTAARDAAFAEGLARGKADSERDRQSAAADMIAEERDALQRALNQCRDLLKLECESVEPLRAERDALLRVVAAADAMRDMGVSIGQQAVHPEGMPDDRALYEFIGLFDGPFQRDYDAARAKLPKEPK